MIIIPFNVENPEKTYKHYSYAEYYSVSIKSDIGIFSKNFIYDFIKEYDTFYDSQFTKEITERYFTGNPDTDIIQLVSDNGYTYTINLEDDTCIRKGNSLYFIPRNKIFKREYSISDIRKFTDTIIKVKDYDLLKKYSKLVNEDFGSLNGDDIYNLVNIRKELNNIRPVIP